MPAQVVDSFNVDGQEYHIEPVLDAVPIEGSQHAVMSGGVFADKSRVPIEGSTKNFTAGGAFDFFGGAVTANDFIKKINPRGRKWGAFYPNQGQNYTYEVAYGATANFPNGVFVAVCWTPFGSSAQGYTHYTYYSEDGVHWNQGSGIAAASDGASVYNICYGGGRFVIGGSARSGVHYSEDGINWYAATGGWSQAAGCFKPRYGNGVYVVCISGENGPYWSEDAQHWTKATVPSTPYNADYTQFVNGIFYCQLRPSSSGAAPYAVYSTDGKTWNVFTSASDPYDAHFITYDAESGKYVAVHTNGISVSADGINWTQKVTFSNSGIGNREHKACYYKGYWYAGSSTLGLYYSSDNGETWSQASASIAATNAACYVGTAGGVLFMNTGSTYKISYDNLFTFLTKANAVFAAEDMIYIDGIWYSMSGRWSPDACNWFESSAGAMQHAGTPRAEGTEVCISDTALVLPAAGGARSGVYFSSIFM